MSDGPESGVGGRESEIESAAKRVASTSDHRLPTPDEPNWPLLYGAVLAELAVLIVIFYAFTKAFA
jgi:hypothetical protein